jgi:hypothetical protein
MFPLSKPPSCLILEFYQLGRDLLSETSQISIHDVQVPEIAQRH